MELLEEARESLFFPACGTQADSNKPSCPRWSLPQASRDAAKKVTISSKHNQDLLGKDSPGFVYEPKIVRTLPKYSFGTAPARPALETRKYPETSNDLLHAIPDSQQFKYPQRSLRMGTASRDAGCNQPDLKGFPPGRISPGPQRYSVSGAPPCVRLSHAPEVDKIPPKWSIRPKTKILQADSQTPPKVGPALYPLPHACGPQCESEKAQLPLWSIHKVERFPKKTALPDSGRLWDGMGDKKIKFSRVCSAPPSFGFGTATRAKAQKVAPCFTQLDKGPAASMPPPRVSQPTLPVHREVIKYSGVPL